MSGKPGTTWHGRTMAERFWMKVRKTSSCWLWEAVVNADGYGQFRKTSRGPMVGAHRVAWELTRSPIPKGMMPDHLCRNRNCVNPDHMEIVTNRVNVLRGIGACAIHARKTHCPEGHPYDVKDRDGRRCRTCRNRQARQLYHSKKGASA